ncbi:hypothetical protein [Halorubrum sp. DTA98]|uniref:hypothetical protein n=1 Tax=Halorubrum sp. DTA98 TaxID=3402163 RepID=UPI003AAD4993
MTDASIDLPFGDAFGPGQLAVGTDDDELVVVLDLIAANLGEPKQFDHAIAERFFEDSPDPVTRAENVRFAVQAANGYGIVDQEFEFTELGTELASLRDEPEALYDRFATHILTNLGGIEVIETIRDLEALGRQTTEANIRAHLAETYDIQLREGSNHWSQMRAWLAKADVINTGIHIYELNDEKIRTLTGIESRELESLDELTPEQQAFLWTLAIVNPDEPIPNSRVRRAAEAGSQLEIKQSNIARRVLEPLEERDYIEMTRADGAPNTVRTTEAFDSEVLRPAVEIVGGRVGIPMTALRTSFRDLGSAIDGQDATITRSEASRVLTAKLGSLLGLDFVGWCRVEGTTEAAVFDRVQHTVERWYLSVMPFDSPIIPNQLHRAVGEANTVGASTVLLVSRHGIDQTARQIANQVVQREPLTVLLVHLDDISALSTEPDQFTNKVNIEAERMYRVVTLGDDERFSIDAQSQLRLDETAVTDQLDSDNTGTDRSLDEFSST